MNHNSLAHTKWECKYHIVFIPKYRRKVMFGQVRKDLQEIIPKYSVPYFMGCLKGKSALMIFDCHPEMKKDNRHFWATGYFVSTVGRDEETIKNTFGIKQKMIS